MYIRMKEDWNGVGPSKRNAHRRMEWNGMAQIPQVTKQWRRGEERERETIIQGKERKGKERKGKERKEEGKKKERRRKEEGKDFYYKKEGGESKERGKNIINKYNIINIQNKKKNPKKKQIYYKKI